MSNSATSRNHLNFLLAATPLLLAVMSLLSPIYNRTSSLFLHHVYPNLPPSPQPCSGETKNVPGGRCLLNMSIRSIIHWPLKNNHKPIMLRGPRSNLYVGGLDWPQPVSQPNIFSLGTFGVLFGVGMVGTLYGIFSLTKVCFTRIANVRLD